MLYIGILRLQIPAAPRENEKKRLPPVRLIPAVSPGTQSEIVINSTLHGLKTAVYSWFWYWVALILSAPSKYETAVLAGK